MPTSVPDMTLLLQYGKHEPDGEACLIERLRIDADQPWSDLGWEGGIPEWAASIGRILNDAYGDAPGSDERRTAALLDAAFGPE